MSTELEKTAKINRIKAALTQRLSSDEELMKTAGLWEWVKKNPWKAVGHGLLTAASFIPVTAPFAWGARGVQAARLGMAAKKSHNLYKATRGMSGLSKGVAQAHKKNWVTNARKARNAFYGPKQPKLRITKPSTYKLRSRSYNLLTAPGSVMSKTPWAQQGLMARGATTAGLGLQGYGTYYMGKNLLNPGQNVKTMKEYVGAWNPNNFAKQQPSVLPPSVMNPGQKPNLGNQTLEKPSILKANYNPSPSKPTLRINSGRGSSYQPPAPSSYGGSGRGRGGNYPVIRGSTGR